MTSLFINKFFLKVSTRREAISSNMRWECWTLKALGKLRNLRNPKRFVCTIVRKINYRWKKVECAECIHGKSANEPIKIIFFSKISRIHLLLVNILKSIEYNSSPFFPSTDSAEYNELKFSIVEIDDVMYANEENVNNCHINKDALNVSSAAVMSVTSNHQETIFYEVSPSGRKQRDHLSSSKA